MDAPEDEIDIKLQKISADLIADFERSLALLLYKKGSSGTRSAHTLRTHVRTRDLARLSAVSLR
jgi:tubulin-specific chaperone D